MTDGPHKLPFGWRWVRLGEAASHLRSGFASRKKGAVNGDLLHLRPYNIAVDGTLDLSQQFSVPSKSAPGGEIFLQPGDILFNNTNSVELVGKTALVKAGLRAAFSNHITHIRTDIEVCEGAWIALALRSLWQQGFFAQRCNKWIGQAGFNTNMLIAIPIPLPPLAEQRRIVARVEALMERVREAKRLREDAITDADGLMRAALKELFSFPGGLPAGWQWTTIADVGDSQRDTVQTGPFGAQLKSSEFTEEGVPVLAIGNVQGGYLDTTDLKYVSESKADQLSRYKIRSGDLLFTRMGTVGRSCVVPGYAEGWLISYHLLRVGVDCSHCLAEYLYYSLGGSQRVLDQLEARSRGATRAGVNTQILMELEFPLPPLAEQHRVIAYLDSIRAQAAALKRAQEDTDAELRRLEQAILDRAFRGEL
jgi:type I restriction enzyme S subunit